jgi:5-methylcytosine-specific restriction enzyme A
MVRRLDGEQRIIKKQQLISRDSMRCNHCMRRFRFRQLTIDHVKPIWKNGTNDLNNLQLLCYKCHTEKSKGDLNYCVIPYMYGKWVYIVSRYRHKSFLKRLVRL